MSPSPVVERRDHDNNINQEQQQNGILYLIVIVPYHLVVDTADHDTMLMPAYQQLHPEEFQQQQQHHDDGSDDEQLLSEILQEAHERSFGASTPNNSPRQSPLERFTPPPIPESPLDPAPPVVDPNDNDDFLEPRPRRRNPLRPNPDDGYLRRSRRIAHLPPLD